MDRVIVSDLRDATFFATICLTVKGESITVDARPSDAIALALRDKAPVERAALRLAVVVRGVAAGQEAEPVVERRERRPEGVRRPRLEPAERAGGDSREHDAALPRVA